MPSTPVDKPVGSRPSTPQTGTWRHPRFEEISRRQNLTTFTDKNLSSILLSFGFLSGTWAIKYAAAWLGSWRIFQFLIPAWVGTSLGPYSIYPLLAIRLLLISNIIVAASPLYRRKDEITDIPLTPSQRALLGLDPSKTPPPSNGTQYETPPRYPRSTTPRSSISDSPGSIYSRSPLSGKGSPLGSRAFGGSPFSPNSLLQKAINGSGKEMYRRSSYSSPSPVGGFSESNSLSFYGPPGTPSPTSGKSGKLLLNSRWLYERGRVTPLSNRV